MQLAKAGYCGGDPVSVMNAPVDIVQGMLDYEGFQADYKIEYSALNKEKT